MLVLCSQLPQILELKHLLLYIIILQPLVLTVTPFLIKSFFFFLNHNLTAIFLSFEIVISPFFRKIITTKK